MREHVNSITNFIRQNISSIHYDSIAWTDIVIGDGNSVIMLNVCKLCFVVVVFFLFITTCSALFLVS